MKLKKLNKSGMTLVEVVIAMAIFSVFTLMITMAFSAAMQYNARNNKRDDELSRQQASLEKSGGAGVMLNNGASLDDSVLIFGGNNVDTFNLDTGTGFVPKVTQYKAVKSDRNGNDINFELHTISSNYLTSALKLDPSNGYYNIIVQNDTENQVDVYITRTAGEFYGGMYDRENRDATGYVHTSEVYGRTLAPRGASIEGILDGAPFNFSSMTDDQKNSLAAYLGKPVASLTEADVNQYNIELQNSIDNSIPSRMLVGYGVAYDKDTCTPVLNDTSDIRIECKVNGLTVKTWHTSAAELNANGGSMTFTLLP